MFASLDIQGNLISEEVLQQIAEVSASGQQATDFLLEPGARLNNEIEYAWSRIRLEWKRFTDKRENLPISDPYGTTLARRWMEDFFKALGFDLVRVGQALEGSNGQRYSISHTAEYPVGLPIHIVGFIHQDAANDKEVNTLDVRSSGGTSRLSPHSTVQEYLNVTSHLYGLVTNGLRLRLLRDSGRLVKLTYIEFDLRRMLEQDQYADFTLLYRLLHISRFGNTDDEENCWLEVYYKQSIETGNRIREGLSAAVMEALRALGNGFICHPDNEALRQAFGDGTLNAKDYYRELLRLVYRLLFLLVTEERDLVYDPEDKSDQTARYRQLYQRFYSLARLRRLSEHRYLYNEAYTDLWPALQATFRLFEAEGNGQKMGIQPLGGDLFSSSAMPHLSNCKLANRLLLECLRNMNEFTDRQSRNLVTINYRALDVEELGSVYEGLLDLHPVVQPTIHGTDWKFTFHEGKERKTTGSYYTPPDLVNELIKSALIPVIEARLHASPGNSEAQAKALLSLKVCDPAAGSGHMLLAAARTIAWYLARVKTGDENPGPSVYRSCLRQVIQHCIYAVDYNSDAVELCKLALWLESHNSGKPLSFLDHKIRNGNSLVGVIDLSVLTEPLPDEAFNSVSGDNPAVCKELKKRNALYRKTKQGSLFTAMGKQMDSDRLRLQEGYAEIESVEQNDLEAIGRIAGRFAEVRRCVNQEEQACNIWVASYFKTYTDIDDPTNPTSEKLAQYFHIPAQFERLAGEAVDLKEKYKFFHWPLEFPDVWAQGGFDVMLGNPPWERIKLQQQEFFATRDFDIANAPNAAARNRMINKLSQSNPRLYTEYLDSMHGADATSKFLREAGRCKLTAVGDINTYSIFAELFTSLVNNKGRSGFIVPTGIATDDSNKAFFGNLIEQNTLISLFDFENRDKLFPSVDSRSKFALLTISGCSLDKGSAKFGFFLTRVSQLQDTLRIFHLTRKDFLRINPNTKTCPVFRTTVDAELATKVYQNLPVLINETTGENPWGVKFSTMFHMANDSSLFRSQKELEADGYNKHGNRIIKGSDTWLPLFEGKMFMPFDHRYADVVITENLLRQGQPETLTYEDHINPLRLPYPRYYINENEVQKKSSERWIIGFKDVTAPTNFRTFLSTILCDVGLNHKVPYIVFDEPKCNRKVLFAGLISTLAFDYFVRQKVGGTSMTYFYVRQFPVINPQDISIEEEIKIMKNVFELTYTSWDIKPFADELWNYADKTLKVTLQSQWQNNAIDTGGHPWLPPEWGSDFGLSQKETTGCPLPPFKWDDERRFIIKAELDAIYAKLYGLTTEELRYILDPQDVYGPDFPGETFRVLKEKEIKQYGEYRTKRLVLEAWTRLNNTMPEKEIHDTKPNYVDLTTSTELMKEWSLHDGIYNIQDCSRITRLSSDKIKRWFKELYKEQYEGFGNPKSTDVQKLRISFHGLIELVVIGTLREAKIKLKDIMVARKQLGSITKKEYPFATNNANNIKIVGTTITFNLPQGNIDLDGSDQFNFDFIKAFFRDIVFDGDIALRMIPEKGKGKIIIDPKEANGRPAVIHKEVPVDSIVQFYLGPESVPSIMNQFELTEEEVLAAVAYYN